MLVHIIAICLVCWQEVNALTGDHVCQYQSKVLLLGCCIPYVEKEEKCIDCPNGTISNDGTNCTKCPPTSYGFQCLKSCKCNNNQECHHEYGCIAIVTTDLSTSKQTFRQYRGSVDNQGFSAMTAMSITIAAFALLVVMITGVIKFFRSIVKHRSFTLPTRNKVESYERKSNIYGTYKNTKICIEDDEHEFDSDSFQDEEAYAVIRDSQVLSTLVATDELGDISIPYDECPHYDTKGYNHLNVMGPRHTPGSQRPFVSNYSDAVFGKKLFTFDE